MIKNSNICKKKYIKALNNIFYELAPLTRDIKWSKLQRDRENVLVSFYETNTPKRLLGFQKNPKKLATDLDHKKETKTEKREAKQDKLK